MTTKGNGSLAGIRTVLISKYYVHLESNPDLRDEKPHANYLSYGRALNIINSI
jgi:hypothetical protein